MSFKLVSFFTFIFAVLQPRVGEYGRASNVFVGCVTENNLTYKFTYNIVDLDFILQELLPILCQLSLK